MTYGVYLIKMKKSWKRNSQIVPMVYGEYTGLSVDLAGSYIVQQVLGTEFINRPCIPYIGGGCNGRKGEIN